MKNVLKKTVVLILSLLCVLSLLCFASCSKENYNFDKESVTIYVGETIKLNLLTYEDITNAVWSIDDETIAIVQNGEVTGISVGETTVKVAFKKGQGSCKVIVKEKPEPEKEEIITTVNISIDNLTAKLTVGESLTLKATAFVNSEEVDGNITYFSSDESVATVDEFGCITAIKNGNVEISATFVYQDGLSATAKCELKVCPFTVLKVEKQIVLDNRNTASIQVQCFIEGQQVAHETFGFESENTEVVKVDENGVLSFVGKGETKITVTHENKAKTTVKVKCVERVGKISSANEFLQIDGASEEVYYVLTNDIDLTTVTQTMFQDRGVNYNGEVKKVYTHQASGRGGVYSIIDVFNSTLDGNGYKIIFNNYTTRDSKFNVMGIFNYISQSAVIKNVYIDTTVNTYAKLGGAGNMPCTATLAYVNKGIIENCYISSELYLYNLSALKTTANYQEQVRASMIFENEGIVKDCIVKFNVFDAQSNNAVEAVRAVFIGGYSTTQYDNVIVISEGQKIFASNYLAGATTTNAPICESYMYLNFSDMIKGENGKYFTTGKGGSVYSQKAYFDFSVDVWTINNYDITVTFYSTLCN